MTGHSEQLAPEETKRRAVARVKAEHLARRMGFRSVAGRPGFWYHDGIDPSELFSLSESLSPVENQGDVIARVFFDGLMAGKREARKQIREALGL